MAFLVDTDICSAHLRNNLLVTRRFLQYTGQLSLSVLSLGELLSWTLRAKSSPKYHQALLTMLSDVSVLEVTSDVAWKFGELRAEQLDRGQPAPAIDLLIASTAIVHGLVVVTHNVQHFSNLSGLAVVDWLAP